MKRTARPDSSLADDNLVGDIELLADLLEESYEATYKGSSLKVRRRYRKLLAALMTAQLQRTQAAVYRVKEHEAVTVRSSS